MSSVCWYSDLGHKHNRIYRTHWFRSCLKMIFWFLNDSSHVALTSPPWAAKPPAPASRARAASPPVGVAILWLAKCLVWRKLGREVTKRRGVSKCRPVLWSSSGRRVPACIHGFLLSSPISIVESDVTCLLRPFERFVYDMHSHK